MNPVQTSVAWINMGIRNIFQCECTVGHKCVYTIILFGKGVFTSHESH